MKQLVIVGAGGMGRTIYDMACENDGHNKEFVIKGFIDDNIHSLDGFENYPPVVSTIREYKVQENDIFVCSIGGELRRECMELIISRGGEFMTMIHPSSRIGTNVKIGKGCYVGAYTIIAADAWIDDYNFIQSHVIVGHDVRLGKWNRVDSYTMFVGGVQVGECNMIHTHSMINHNVIVGNHTKIAACAFVISNVEDGATVFGNPARRLK